MSEKDTVVDEVVVQSQEDEKIEGRSAFAVKTTDIGVAVAPVFIDKEGKVREVKNLPAIFPTREYALEQIKGLTELINHHFDEFDAAVEAKKRAN